ncbi:Vacuolar protein sorting-associated protein 9A [Zea mays]|uniref:Vacuolar protein sorting-associated protein 9A n=1 Tax=Zea mays TaxID=4577 RepID=A0A1D6P345_MAIZE|nr:Vacuolar protein sorting-associated protein 9A [Zea mays]
MFIFALKVVCFFAKRACMRLVSCGSRQAGGQCVLQEIHLLLICMQTETVLCLRRNSSRILARKSAQRSRVRKLQYISELERSVTTLQKWYDTTGVHLHHRQATIIHADDLPYSSKSFERAMFSQPVSD